MNDGDPVKRSSARVRLAAVGNIVDLPLVLGGRACFVALSNIQPQEAQNYSSCMISLYGHIGETRVLLVTQQLPDTLDTTESIIVARWSGHWFEGFSAQIVVAPSGTQPPLTNWQLSSDELAAPADVVTNRLKTGRRVVTAVGVLAIPANPSRRAVSMLCATSGQEIFVAESLAALATAPLPVPTVGSPPNTYLRLQTTAPIYAITTLSEESIELRWIEECVD